MNNPTSSPEFTFTYPIKNSPHLKELKDLANLNLNAGDKDIEDAKEIISFCHGLFTHDGDNTPSANDPLTILKEAKDGANFRCVEYSTLAAGLLWAHDIPARTIGLKIKDVETREYGAGHVVIEFWSVKHNKWIMSDIQAGIIPLCNDNPLSAYELKQTLDQNETISFDVVESSTFTPDLFNGSLDGELNYLDWIKEAVYFIDTPSSLKLGNEKKSKEQIVMLVPDGAQNPIMFQGLFKMIAIYTQNIAAFYASPVYA